MNWINDDDTDELEPGECVLVCDVHNKLVTFGKLISETDKNGEPCLTWYVVDSEHVTKVPCDFYVTHWMRFPELPQEEE